jgi:hypothetical protein
MLRLLDCLLGDLIAENVDFSSMSSVDLRTGIEVYAQKPDLISYLSFEPSLRSQKLNHTALHEKNIIVAFLIERRVFDYLFFFIFLIESIDSKRKTMNVCM